MTFVPRPQEIYKHFKGNLYQIVTIAEHSETGELLVIYQALYGDFRIYARPLEQFLSKVDRVKYPEATQEYRFALQGPGSDRQKNEEDVKTVEAAAEEAKAAEMEVTEAKAAEVETVEDAPEELQLDPMVLAFLDADTYEERLNILSGLQHKITDEMLTTMAIACDIELNEGSTAERYEMLKGCLLTLERYECNRLR